MEQQTRLLDRIEFMIERIQTDQYTPEDADVLIDTLNEAKATMLTLVALADAYRGMYKKAEDKYTRLVNRRQAGNKPRGRTNT